MFSCVSSVHLHKRMHSHTGCIWLALFHSVFSNASSNCLPESIQSHIGYTCLTFLQCVFSNVSLICLLERLFSHIDCTCLTFLHFLALSFESLYWRCFCLNDAVQALDPSPASIISCLLRNSPFKLRRN